MFDLRFYISIKICCVAVTSSCFYCGMFPVSSVSYFMEGRDSSQLSYRWTCVLDPSIKKGPWTKEEDEVQRAVWFSSVFEQTQISSIWPVLRTSLPSLCDELDEWILSIMFEDIVFNTTNSSVLNYLYKRSIKHNAGVYCVPVYSVFI